MSIENDLHQLKVDKDNPVGSFDVETQDNDVLRIASLTKESKKKKKKKDKKNGSAVSSQLDKLMGDSVSNLMDSDEDESLMALAKNIKKNSEKKGGKLVFDSDKFRDDDDGDGKKKKDITKEFRADFKGQTALLTALLKEADMDNKKIKSIFAELTGSKVRGVSKTLTDVMSALNTSNNNKLAIVKEMISLNKTIHDLSMKKSGQKKEQSGGNHDPIGFGASVFNDIFGQGRKTILDNVRAASAVPQEQIDGFRNGNIVYDGPESSIDSNEDPDAFIEERLRNEQGSFRTEDGNKLIEYESVGAKVKIAKTEDGDWYFIGVDKFDQRIDDYPVPDKSDIGKMSFSDDADIATDMYGRSYEVIPLLE